jgi:hypothetical protein
MINREMRTEREPMIVTMMMSEMWSALNLICFPTETYVEAFAFAVASDAERCFCTNKTNDLWKWASPVKKETTKVTISQQRMNN